MKNPIVDRILLAISLLGFLCMSASFMLMPIEALTLLPGILFWSGLLVGIATQVLLAVRRRSFFAGRKQQRRQLQARRNGLLTFGANGPALVVDCLLGVSLVALVLTFVLTKGYSPVCFVCITATLLTFCLHCILNGRIFYHITHFPEIRQELETMKANTQDKGEGET